MAEKGGNGMYGGGSHHLGNKMLYETGAYVERFSNQEQMHVVNKLRQ